MILIVSGASSNNAPHGRFTIVYLIHDAFRRDFARLSHAVEEKGVTRERASTLSSHWEFMKEQLDHHHRVEDDSLWPLVRPKLSGRDAELQVLQDMETQHRGLEPATTEVDREFAAFAADPGSESGSRLGERIQALGNVLEAHLGDEETRCFPIVDEALDGPEFESFGKATAKAVGIRGSARFFPWIFDSADPLDRAAVLTLPPPPVRVLCRYSWEPRYKRQTERLWGNA
jgi:hemerythrin-like domain-containing protein